MTTRHEYDAPRRVSFCKVTEAQAYRHSNDSKPAAWRHGQIDFGTYLRVWNGEADQRRLQVTPSRVSLSTRRRRFGHPSVTLLLTGLSGAGKTTLAFAIEEKLFAAGYAISVVDGQNLRLGISRDLRFSSGERSENLRRAAEICRLLNEAGIICIAAFVAPDHATRLKARQVIGDERLLHIHLTAPLEVCRNRDRSGRYLAADRGEIVSFPGVTAPYELPADADLVIRTDEGSISQCLQEIEAAVLLRLEKLDGSFGEWGDHSHNMKIAENLCEIRATTCSARRSYPERSRRRARNLTPAESFASIRPTYRLPPPRRLPGQRSWFSVKWNSRFVALAG